MPLWQLCHVYLRLCQRGLETRLLFCPVSTGTHSCDLSPPLCSFFCVSLTPFFFPCKCCLCCRQYNVSTQFTESISVRSLLKIGWPTNGLFTPHGWPCRRLHHFDGSVHVDSHTTLWQLFCPLEVPGGINYFSLFIFNLIIESLSIYC